MLWDSPVFFLSESSNLVDSGVKSDWDRPDSGGAAAFAVLNDKREIDDAKLAIYSEPRVEGGSSTEFKNKLVKSVFAETTRAQDLRLITPLTWRGEVSHKLTCNFDLS